MSLGQRVAIRMGPSMALMAGIVFLPAGSWSFWQGWAFLAAFLLPSLSGMLYFLRYDRQLVERRLRVREKVKEQQWLMSVGMVLFLAVYLLPGFDRRLGWSRRWVGEVPVWLTVVSLCLVAGGILFVCWVLKVNSYAGRTIEVEAGQKVISTGPYAWVRHPMYLGSLVFLALTPLALGSWLALPAFALMVPFFALRLLNEEKVLRAQLPGYSDYCRKTPFRLIPYIW
jgi:protein-S-isoprenylcysteine O-methyltransferase Ste14